MIEIDLQGARNLVKLQLRYTGPGSLQVVGLELKDHLRMQHLEIEKFSILNDTFTLPPALRCLLFRNSGLFARTEPLFYRGYPLGLSDVCDSPPALMIISR